jgi:hypothetical protein
LVDLSWSVPADGGSALTGFKVYRSTTPGDPAPTLVTTLGPTAVSYQNTGLTNGTTYYFRVAAVNGVGETSSSERSAAPAAAVPPDPVVARPWVRWLLPRPISTWTPWRDRGRIPSLFPYAR